VKRSRNHVGPQQSGGYVGPQEYGSLLTTGKRPMQEVVYSREAFNLTDEPPDRTTKLRWFALLLHLTPDIKAHAKEFEEILLLLP
jgi:hypothetical protein